MLQHNLINFSCAAGWKNVHPTNYSRIEDDLVILLR
jgi:hypothetical protein